MENKMRIFTFYIISKISINYSCKSKIKTNKKYQ